MTLTLIPILLLIICALVAAAVLLLCVRPLAGRRFVNTHIDGNSALNRQGIRCVKEMDRRERRANPRRVSERTNSKEK